MAAEEAQALEDAAGRLTTHKAKQYDARQEDRTRARGRPSCRLFFATYGRRAGQLTGVQALPWRPGVR